MVNEPELKVVFVANANNAIGRQIVRRLLEDWKVVKRVYHSEASASLPEFRKAGIPPSSRLLWFPSRDTLPADVTHVIVLVNDKVLLEPIGKKLSEHLPNVLKTLDSCRKRKNIRGISVLSTGYVQPPPPYIAPEDGRIPFLLGEGSSVSASDLYRYSTRMNEMGLEHDQQLGWFVTFVPYYYQVNTFALAYHIMEHVINEDYADLPIAFVRPSIICSKWCLDNVQIETFLKKYFKATRKTWLRKSKASLPPEFEAFTKEDVRICLDHVASMSIMGLSEAEKFEPEVNENWRKILVAKPQVSDLTPSTMKALKKSFKKKRSSQRRSKRKSEDGVSDTASLSSNDSSAISWSSFSESSTASSAIGYQDCLNMASFACAIDFDRVCADPASVIALEDQKRFMKARRKALARNRSESQASKERRMVATATTYEI